MSNKELMLNVIDTLSPEFEREFKRRVIASTKMQKLFYEGARSKVLVQYDCDRRARRARTFVRNHSTKYSAETPEQAYDRVYEARAAVYLHMLAEVLQPLLCADRRST